MKIGDPIDQDKVPPRRSGRKPIEMYDLILAKVMDLPEGKALPIVCDNASQASHIYKALRRRSRNLDYRMQDNMIYIQTKKGKTG